MEDKPTSTRNDETEFMVPTIQELVDHWSPIMGLDGWRRYLAWDEDDTVASCISSPRYRQWIANFDLDKITDPQRACNIEELIVHEMSHGLHWKAWDYADLLARLMSQALGLKGKAKEIFAAMHKFYISEVMEEQATQIGWALMRAAGHEIPEPTFDLHDEDTPGIHAEYNPDPIAHQAERS